MTGHQSDSLTQLLFGIGPLLAPQRDEGTRCPRLSIVGIQLEALLDSFQGVNGVVLLHIDIGTHGIALGKTAPTGEDGVEFGQGGVKLVVADMAEHAVVPHVAVVGVIFQGSRVVLDGFRELFLTNTRQATQVVEVDDKRIALDGLGTVAFGTGKVIKVELGHTTEEPRFVEIGLGVDGLIKILDGEDIVLVIERRPPDGDEPVGIILCKNRNR